MKGKFEYKVCQTQYDRITFVDGKWQGSLGPQGVEINLALESCPWLWDHLKELGIGGWELTSAVVRQVDKEYIQILYFKREMVP